MSFDQRAQDWDSSSRRRELARALAEAITKRIEMHPSMRVLDIGAGTGLLSRQIRPYVASIVAVDSSKAMLEKLLEYSEEIETVHSDILDYRPKEQFDGIISSMTLHHIKDIEHLMRHLHSMLKRGAFIALGDLAPEKGDFHDHGNEGVYHFGFDEATITQAALKAGFRDCVYELVYKIDKGDGRVYDVFLFSAIA